MLSLITSVVHAETSDENFALDLDTQNHIEKAISLLTEADYINSLSIDKSVLSAPEFIYENIHTISQACKVVKTEKLEANQVIDLKANNNQKESCKPQSIAQNLQQQLQILEQQRNQKPLTPNQQKLPEKVTPSQEVNKQQEDKPQEKDSEDSKYIRPTQNVDKNKVNTFTTTLLLNGILINHLTQTDYGVGQNFGDGLNTDFNFNGMFKLDSQIKESLTKDNILTIDQTGSYIQAQTVTKKNEVTVTRKEPQTLFGLELQLSLTASCIFPGTPSDQQCTYTPGLATDRNSIDPDTLLPKRVFQTSQVGDVVTPESLAAIQEPGFQRGANGQEIGVDLYFPNAGSFSGNTQSNKTAITRKETIENTPAGFYSTVRQLVRINDKESVIGRTVRGYGFIVDDKNSLLNSTLQLSNLLLPDIDPQIEGGKNPANTNINQNLFFAANNTRLPTNSFTIYHGGIGRAETPKPGSSLNQLPPGFFDSVWFGLSPVTKRSLTNQTRYEITGPSRVLADAGGEGGINSNVSLLSLINGQGFSTQTLNNFYAQINLGIYNQDVNYVNISKYTQDINYYPHLSISGNVTGFNDVWRYFGGLIAGEKTNAYIGTDYSKTTTNGWNYNIGATIYTNPDTDYYSQAQGSISKKIPLSQSNNLVLSTGFNYAIDRKLDVGGTIFNLPTSSVFLGARTNIGQVSFGLTNYFGGILPNSIDNNLLADVGIKLSDNFAFSAYFTPINNNPTRSRYGVQTQWKLGNDDKSPTLVASWANNEYNYGIDAGGNKLDTNNNVFTIFLRANY